MVVLHPMPPQRFEEFAAVVGASHAAHGVASGRWLESESVRLSREELDGLLPQQLATPDHHFYEIKPNPSGPVVGFVWFGKVPIRDVQVAFVFQLFIYAAFRRQGYGRAALVQVEELAAAMGLGTVVLNVFGSNTEAQALYRSLGYAITSMSMRKQLQSSRVA